MASMYMRYEIIMREERIERRRKLRQFRNLLHINRLPDANFISTYRLTKSLFEELCQDIVPLLPSRASREAITPVAKILTALNFFARGSHQGAVGLSSDGPMSQQSVSRCLHEVLGALVTKHILLKYIKFPKDSRERHIIKRKFFAKHGIPGVIGCIDCTHVAIIKPAEQEEACFNTKHFYSLNVQAICDVDCYFTHACVQYGGATHDSFIFHNTPIRPHLESLSEETTYLLGDSGYPQRVYMMTPVNNAVEDTPEGRYNIAHKRAHCTIERAFRILKSRWRCLLSTKQLHYSPEVAGKIIIACFVLHNMCIRAGLEDEHLSNEEEQAEASRQPVAASAHYISASPASRKGLRARNNLINQLEQVT